MLLEFPFSDKVEFSSQAKSSTTHYQFLLSQLDKLDFWCPATENQILHRRCTRLQKRRKRSLIVIFSDMFDNADNMEEILVPYNISNTEKHEVILFTYSIKI